MHNFIPALVVSGLLCIPTSFLTAQSSLSDQVDPFIGTGGHGHTYPGAAAPFGMVQLSPDAGKGGWDWCSGYHYSDTALIGFSHTHLSGTGCADLGDILFMPTTSWRNVDRRYRSPFSHEHEQAAPGYYAVRLLDNDIQVELTATRRSGMHRYTFPESDSARVIVDVGHGQDDKAVETAMRLVNDRLLTGCRVSSGWAPLQRVFFAAIFSAPVVSISNGSDGQRLRSSHEFTGRAALAVLSFGRISTLKPLIVRVGISSVSEENALDNLRAELPDEDFDLVRSGTRQQWDQALSQIEMFTTDAALRRTFATAMYHSMLAPTLYSDTDGRYRGGDDSVHTADGYEHYTVFSLWDTFRALHPLFTILNPLRVSDWVQSMLAFKVETGLLPVWTLHANETNCMIGYHAVPVIADAFLKGIEGVDGEAALAAMKSNATQDKGGLRFYSTVAGLDLDSVLAANRNTTPLASMDWSTVAAVVNGYDTTVAGATLGYHSSHPDAHTALITRATDTPMPIQWESDPVPEIIGRGSVALTWLAGMSTNKGGNRFTLSVDGQELLSFRTPRTADSAIVTVQSGAAILQFAADMTDEFGDLFGTMTLLLPRDLVTPGKRVSLRLQGESAGSQDWVMTFTHSFTGKRTPSTEIGRVRDPAGELQFARVAIEHTGLPDPMIFTGDAGIPASATLYPGYNTVLVPIRAVERDKETLIVCAPQGGGRGDTLRAFLAPASMPRYIPADKENESVSKTLEYAYDDWCIAKVAAVLGKSEDERLFTERSQYYRSLFDPDLGFMRGRNFNGSWRAPFNPRFSTLKQHEYTEGNAWQYSWFVPHDVDGLIELMGGREAFCRKLDSLFEQSSDLEDTGATGDVTGLIGLYAHGNEPSHHIAYLYNRAGQPWKTQQLVRRIMREMYHDKSDGLIGNEDCGQMSAWYVFSAMGFYPLNPCGGIYEIGSPLFDRVVLNLDEGRQFIIEAENNGTDNVYIQSATLNDEPLAKPQLLHDVIMHGGTLRFVMGPEPSTLWTDTR